MSDYNKLKAFFPYNQIRPEQESVLKQIAANWESKKYFILQLDVGTGKSGIAKCCANMAQNAFIITETKQLQQQYINDFSHENNMVSIKGKANYACNQNFRLNCENGPCTLRENKSQMPKCWNSCKYYSLRQKALASQVVLTSYAYIFRAFDCAGFWQPRDLMVFDECHLIESQLTNFAQFKLDPAELDKNYGLYNKYDSFEMKKQMQAFTNEGFEANKSRYNDIFNLVEDKRKSLFDLMKEQFEDSGVKNPEDLNEDQLDALGSTHKVYYEIDKLYKKMEMFKNSCGDDKSWLIAPNSEGALEFTPLFVNNLFESACEHWANKFIFMSATILDTDGFIKELGLDPAECLVIKGTSTFDPAKSPIYYMPCGSMSYENVAESMPNVEKAVQMIMKSKTGQHGIIHTGNYKIAQQIYHEIPDRRFLMKTSDAISNTDLLKMHEKTKDSVLVSPSMTTGVDLKDDLSRFQIIVKMPFGSLADLRTKRKADIDSTWYAIECLKTLIQASGRSTRSATDYSVTYVLDSSFKYWVNKYKRYLPQSFLNRIKGL